MNEETAAAADTAAEVTNEAELCVPVKFNKQTRMLSVEQAATLAQKGLKFDMISDELKRLGALAAKRDMSVSGYIDTLENEATAARRAQLIEQCGGNEELAEHVLTLEGNRKGDNGLDELREFFPAIRSMEQLPETVTQAVELKGTRPLDEYLRYLFTERRKRKENEKNSREAQAAGVGSQRQYGPRTDAANAEFLRGIWSK